VIEVHYRLVHALARGFRLLGVDTRPVSRIDARALRGSHVGCFEHALPGDLTTTEGVKLVGGAQYRRAEVVMEQMSIPIEPLPDVVRACLNPWNEPTPSPLQSISRDELVWALTEGLAAEFGVEWQEASLSDAELVRARRLLARYC
jgi:lipoate-protein ligase A